MGKLTVRSSAPAGDADSFSIESFANLRVGGQPDGADVGPVDLRGQLEDGDVVVYFLGIVVFVRHNFTRPHYHSSRLGLVVDVVGAEVNFKAAKSDLKCKKICILDLNFY